MPIPETTVERGAMLGQFATGGLVRGLPFRILLAPVLIALLAAVCHARQQPDAPIDPFPHYAAARQHLAAGDEQQASTEFKLFLATVLHSLASATAATGHFEKAEPLFEEAVSVSPLDITLRMEYSRVLFSRSKFPQARQQAQEACRLDPQNPEAILLLGQVLYQLRDYANARAQLESAFNKNPSFAVGYLLGKADLALHDDKAARSIFDSMLRQWGDTDGNHIFLGRAYSQMGYQSEATAEFHKAMEMNPRVHGAHYQLGLSYLREDESAEYDKAVPEFRAELAINPDDFPSHYMLGYIAVNQAQWNEAEAELLRAIALRPSDQASLLALADTYSATNRTKEAEATLRQTLAAAGDQTSQEIARAHYLLGRILLAQPGKQEEAKHELSLVAEMQKHSGTVLTADARAAGAGSLLRQEQAVDIQPPPSSPAEPAGPESHAADDLRATIADAYNNLGAIAGNAHDFAAAATDFQRARQWNPALPGLDHNLGMALFYSSQFREAAPLLKTYLEANSDDVAARGALGFSRFRSEDYAGVVEALRPMQDQMAQTPKLAFVYAASLARTGAYDEGIPRLQSLETATPNSAEIHYELSLAFQHMGKAEDAAREIKLYEGLKGEGSKN
ncbi:MAG TPA: tetratricopeptide repeat protein [Candidatus Sulfotelmatobacter sp.]|nr:tetratricopeptide repeat protein [Candidatus Sulfotelmatobacter sp.]